MAVNSECARYHILPEYLEHVAEINVASQALFNFLMVATIVDVGSEAMVFEIGAVQDIQAGNSNPPTDGNVQLPNVLRVPLYSVLGREAVIAILQHHQQRSPIALDSIISELSELTANRYHIYARYQQFRIRQRIAFANANFGATPQLTIPINAMVRVGGRPAATFERRITGRKPYNGELAKLKPLMDATGAEFAPGNVFLNVTDGTGLSLHALHFIDFSKMPLAPAVVMALFNEYVAVSSDS